MNNTLLIQATAQEYESIQQLVKELDVPPRQVLIEAKIYSIDLTHAFSSDVTAALQAIYTEPASIHHSGFVARRIRQRSHSFRPPRWWARAANSGHGDIDGIGEQRQDSFGSLRDRNRQHSGYHQRRHHGSHVARSISSAIGGAVTTAVTNTSTGIRLTITARVTPSGIVTMIINQKVSDPTATTTSSIESPSFANKSIQTQVTVQDGDTIAIGGMIQESTTSSSGGIPVLDRIPVVGALFGSRSYSKERTELIIFLTPHVIFDSNQLLDATDELKDQIKVMRKDIKE